MFGLDDPWVAAAYVLSAASAVLCVVYSALNWNRGGGEVQPEDIRWAAEEDKVEKNL